MSEERIGTEVNMDEYMTKAEYATKFPGVVDEATHANTAQGCNNAFALGGERPEYYAAKSDVTELESRINVALVGKVDKDDGKGLSTEDYTTVEKEKLAGIEAGANNYVHPATHPASMIEGLPEVVQGTGPSTTAVMSQKAVTDTIDARVNGADKGDVEPIGTYKFFAGEMLPEGYLWCDGKSYPANGDYQKLCKAIGTRYNQSGDAEETFRVPDMRGRVGVGKNAATFSVLGKVGGEEAHTLTATEMPAHTHTQNAHKHQDSGHEHPVRFKSGYRFSADGGSGAGALRLPYDATTARLETEALGTLSYANIGNATAINQASGGSGPHNNLQPYMVCNYIIRYARSYGETGVTMPPCIWNIAAADWKGPVDGNYTLSIPASKHGRGEYCVLTALYKDAGNGVLRQMIPEMQKDNVGNITIISDMAFAGKAYIDSTYMQPAGRVLTVNGESPDRSGNVNVFEHPIVLGESNYGNVLPENLKMGQLFFLIEE